MSYHNRNIVAALCCHLLDTFRTPPRAHSDISTAVVGSSWKKQLNLQLIMTVHVDTGSDAIIASLKNAKEMRKQAVKLLNALRQFDEVSTQCLQKERELEEQLEQSTEQLKEVAEKCMEVKQLILEVEQLEIPNTAKIQQLQQVLGLDLKKEKTAAGGRVLTWTYKQKCWFKYEIDEQGYHNLLDMQPKNANFDKMKELMREKPNMQQILHLLCCYFDREMKTESEKAF